MNFGRPLRPTCLCHSPIMVPWAPTQALFLWLKALPPLAMPAPRKGSASGLKYLHEGQWDWAADTQASLKVLGGWEGGEAGQAGGHQGQRGHEGSLGLRSCLKCGTAVTPLAHSYMGHGCCPGLASESKLTAGLTLMDSLCTPEKECGGSFMY